MALETTTVSGNEVRVPDPKPGQAVVIARYGKERAMVLHPTDYHRLSALDALVSAVSFLEPFEASEEALRAHREEDTPGSPITDPALLSDLFGA